MKILREKRGNRMHCVIFARKRVRVTAIRHGDDCYRECRAGLVGLWPRISPTVGEFDQSTQHADTERLFLEQVIIAPRIARRNIFVLPPVKQAVRACAFMSDAGKMDATSRFGRISMDASTFAHKLR